jgi:GNAT superfamily N-acetyltransferase
MRGWTSHVRAFPTRPSVMCVVAFVLADSWQGHGLGTALLSRLAARARQVGITRFIAATLSDNAPILSVFRHAGLPITECSDDGIVELTIDLAFCP